MIFEIYYEADFELRITLFDIEIYERIEDGIIVPAIAVHPALGNFMTYFHKRCEDKEFDKEAFVRDTDYINMIYYEMFPLFERKARFKEILDRLERIINRYAEKWGLEVNVD